MLKTKIFRGETKVLDARRGRVSAVVSSEAPDRDGDIIRVEGWDFDNFMKHPVLLADHNYRSIRAQIGEWEDMKVVKGRKTVEGVARYYINEGNDDADWGFKLAEKGRAAYSIGFIPDLDRARPAAGGKEPRDEFPFFTGPMEFNGQEMLEASHVTIPANPEALQRMKGLGLHPVIAEIADEVLKDFPLLDKSGMLHREQMDLERLLRAVEEAIDSRLTGQMVELKTLIQTLALKRSDDFNAGTIVAKSLDEVLSEVMADDHGH